MPILFDRAAHTPQTHVLIIGVGGYTYLPGGISAHSEETIGDKFMGIEQLTSPPISGNALLEAVLDIEQQGGWIAPLGSVDVLLSAPDGQPVETTLGVAGQPTLENIQQAYDSWREKCDRHSENVAIFYYCGHGLERAEQYLLAEDFMKIPKRAQEKAFNITDTRRGFHHCRSERRIFFIDACRKIHPDALSPNFNPGSLEDGVFIGATPAFSFIQQSTVPTMGAFGRPNEVSVYTKALISALRGQVAKNEDDDWVVETGYIALKMDELIECQQITERSRQMCSHTFSESAPIIRYSQPPDVLLDVISDPSELQNEIRYNCFGNGGLLLHAREPDPSVWSISVKAGIYVINAQSAIDPARNKRVEFMAEPPRKKRKIKLP